MLLFPRHAYASSTTFATTKNPIRASSAPNAAGADSGATFSSPDDSSPVILKNRSCRISHSRRRASQAKLAEHLDRTVSMGNASHAATPEVSLESLLELPFESTLELSFESPLGSSTHSYRSQISLL